jgi:hypothetical protein
VPTVPLLQSGVLMATASSSTVEPSVRRCLPFSTPRPPPPAGWRALANSRSGPPRARQLPPEMVKSDGLNAYPTAQPAGGILPQVAPQLLHRLEIRQPHAAPASPLPPQHLGRQARRPLGEGCPYPRTSPAGNSVSPGTRPGTQACFPPDQLPGTSPTRPARPAPQPARSACLQH